MDIQNGTTMSQMENSQVASKILMEYAREWLETEKRAEELTLERLQRAKENSAEYQKHMWENPH